MVPHIGWFLFNFLLRRKKNTSKLTCEEVLRSPFTVEKLRLGEVKLLVKTAL